MNPRNACAVSSLMLKEQSWEISENDTCFCNKEEQRPAPGLSACTDYPQLDCLDSHSLDRQSTRLKQRN